MSPELTDVLDARTRRAVAELCQTIQARYPTALFDVAPGPDEPGNVHVTAIVDLDDPDEVLDLVIDRVVELQVEERIPIHVIPIRTPARVRANQSQRGAAPWSQPGSRPTFRLPDEPAVNE